MNEDQKALFDDLAPLAQKVCINIIAGMSNIDAYIEAGGKGSTKEAKESSVSKMLSNDKAVLFLDSMKAEVVNEAIMSRERMMEIQTAIANMSDTDLAQMGVGFLTEMKPGFDVKLKAMKQLAELAGYEAPKEIKVDVKEALTPWDLITIGDEESEVDG